MRFLSFAILLTSASAFACPDLSGTFATCRSLNGNATTMSNVVITQTEEGFMMESTDAEGTRASEMIYTDGRAMVETETDAESGLTMTTTTTATCVGGSNLNLNSDLSVNEQPIGNMLISVSRSGPQLIQEITGEVMGQPVTDTVVCE